MAGFLFEVLPFDLLEEEPFEPLLFVDEDFPFWVAEDFCCVLLPEFPLAGAALFCCVLPFCGVLFCEVVPFLAV